MTITRPTSIVDLDSCAVYRLANVRNAQGDYTSGYQRVHTGYAINFHGTHNYDERIGRGLPAILKRQNIMQADVVTCSSALDFKAEDVLYVTLRDGTSQWVSVVGMDDTRPASGYQVFFTTPTNAPKVFV